MDDLTEWHSIRPWRPTLALSVREITSVSVTFILSSPYNTPASPTSSSSDLEPHSDSDADADGAQTQVVADVLAKGLSVKVNGIPWQRVLIRIDEEADEAVIILFGLMPGRQYDVELGVLPGERSIRGQITTGELSFSAIVFFSLFLFFLSCLWYHTGTSDRSSYHSTWMRCLSRPI